MIMNTQDDNTNVGMEQKPQNGTIKTRRQRIRNITLAGFLRFLRSRFDLSEDKADQSEVVEAIGRSVEFKGTNLWVLMFAIVVASVGLNVNSTAVIIGAMLISPLMGPIMGIGLSLGINDFDLLKRSLRNFFFATAVSLLVSMLYFMISPLTVVQDELLSRTYPTIWDVLIATFGGLAGIVAQSRRDRTTTVIPGVAIATALMPPLCTAGFGIATGEWSYFGGAIYLFFINAVFIALASFFIVRFMKYDTVKMIDTARSKRVKRIMAMVVLVTVVPSVLMAYNLVQRSIFENSAKNYIQEVFDFSNSEVVNSNIVFSSGDDDHIIEVVLIGEPLSTELIEVAQRQLQNYSLHGTVLKVRQADNNEELSNEMFADMMKTNSELLAEKNTQIKILTNRLERYDSDTLPTVDIAKELGSLWPEINTIELSRSKVVNTKGELQGVLVNCTMKLNDGEHIDENSASRIRRWLSQRTGHEEVRLIIDLPEVTQISADSTSVVSSNVLILE